MDPDPNVSAVLWRNEELVQENTVLKSLLLEWLTGRQPSSLWQNTFSEAQVQRDFQQRKSNHEQRTSSLADFKSLVQNSVNTDESDETAENQSCRAESPAEVTGPDRLLGEIAYQLDRRILFLVFQGHKRLYGFTLLNVPQRIQEVSTHPLTGKVDEGYRHFLTQRHAELMQRLTRLGYKAALHPHFSELIVNTFGVLKERPGESGGRDVDYNDPDFLRRLIEARAPRKLRRDLLVLLSCLCSLAERDGKPLLLW